MNPDHRCRGVRSAEVDGVPTDAGAIPLVDDGETHDVVVVLGEAAELSLRAARTGQRRGKCSRGVLRRQGQGRFGGTEQIRAQPPVALFVRPEIERHTRDVVHQRNGQPVLRQVDGLQVPPAAVTRVDRARGRTCRRYRRARRRIAARRRQDTRRAETPTRVRHSAQSSVRFAPWPSSRRIADTRPAGTDRAPGRAIARCAQFQTTVLPATRLRPLRRRAATPPPRQTSSRQRPGRNRS